MEELISIKNKESVTTSLLVAEKFEKRHDRVLRAIENMINDSPQNCGQFFYKSSYKDSSGKSNKMYYMNRDGFSLLAMGFTGKKAMEWKIQYINAFNAMESILSETKTSEWVEMREEGKLTRKSETDIISKLVEYAKEQGSTHSNMLYMTYSKLANKIAQVKDRNMATIRQLSNLDMIERIILFEIDNGMAHGLDYHEIYQRCKGQVEHFSEFTYMNRPLITNA